MKGLRDGGYTTVCNCRGRSSGGGAVARRYASRTVELEVRLLETPDGNEREELRSQLLAAGLLATFDDLDDDLEYVSDTELEELVILPPGAPSSEQLIDEDRGSH